MRSRCPTWRTTSSTTYGRHGCGRTRRDPAPAIQQRGAAGTSGVTALRRGKPIRARSLAEGARFRSARARSILSGLAAGALHAGFGAPLVAKSKGPAALCCCVRSSTPDAPWTRGCSRTMRRRRPLWYTCWRRWHCGRHGASGQARQGERRLLAGGVVALFVVTTGAGLVHGPKNRFYFSATDYHVNAKRETVAERLGDEPGEHLVLVRYGPRHDLWEELVYNRADIDGSRIVWARSLGRRERSASCSRLLRQTQGLAAGRGRRSETKALFS